MISHSNNTNNNKINLRIKPSNAGTNDFTLKANLDDNVEDLGDKILLELDKEDKHIRLIFSGKLLQPPNSKLRDFNIVDGSYIHAVISNVASSPADAPPIAVPAPPIDPSLLRGLDRLQNDGLSIDEVAAIRSAFRPQLTTFSATVERETDEDNVTYMSRVEDLWMASQHADSEFSMNLPRSRLLPTHGLHNYSLFTADQPSVFRSSIEGDEAADGTMLDFVWGFAMGSMLGFMMIFCIWDRNVPHKQKVGILAGVATSLAMAVIQQKILVSKFNNNAIYDILFDFNGIRIGPILSFTFLFACLFDNCS
eukprot:gene13737-29212_t